MTKSEATRKGRSLLKRLKLKNKRLEVFENLGWHAAVRSKGISHISVPNPDWGATKYFALVNPSYACFHDQREFKDPNRAVRHAVQSARKYANHIDALVRIMEEEIR
jgi:hypothetical protein